MAFVTMIKEFDFEGIVLRLVISMLLGVVIGLDREFKNKRAGLKTHALVCLGAAVCMIVSEYVNLARPDLATDASRLGANVVTGVGFLGAATIMVTGNSQVRGLTTAAGVWTCACIGLAMGAGYVELAVVATLLVLFIFVVLDRADARIYRVSRSFGLYAELESLAHVKDFLAQCHELNVRFSNLRVRRSESGDEGAVVVTLTCSTARFGEKQGVLSTLSLLPYVTYLENY